MKYVFPAVLTPEKEGGYSVNFPDVPNCFTFGDSLSEALENAADVLALMLFDREKKGQPIPSPTDIYHLPQGSTYVVADTTSYQRDEYCRAVKKTLTIPFWLNALSEKANLPYSFLLQEALKEKLGVYSYDEFICYEQQSMFSKNEFTPKSFEERLKDANERATDMVSCDGLSKDEIEL